MEYMTHIKDVYISKSSVYVSQHSTRDGGFQKPDTILSLLSWSYRNLQERINDCPPKIKSDFDCYAQRHVAAFKIQKW